MKQLRILIVDEDPRTDQILSDVLAGRSFELHRDDDEREAVERVGRESFHLVVLSGDTPEGFTACDRLKGSRETAEVPVVIVTESVSRMAVSLHRRSKTRADAYFARPLDGSELAATLGKLWPRAESAWEGFDNSLADAVADLVAQVSPEHSDSREIPVHLYTGDEEDSPGETDINDQEGTGEESEAPRARTEDGAQLSAEEDEEDEAESIFAEIDGDAAPPVAPPAAPPEDPVDRAVAASGEETEELRRALGSAESARDEAKAALAVVKSEHSAFEEEMRQIREERDGLSGAFARTLVQRDRARTERDGFKDQVERLQEQLEAREAELEEQAKQREEERRAIAARLEELTEALSEARAEHQDLVADLKRQLEEALRTQQERDERLREAKTECDLLRAEGDATAAKVANLEARMAELKKAEAASKELAQSQSQRVESLELEIDQERARCEALRKALATRESGGAEQQEEQARRGELEARLAEATRESERLREALARRESDAQGASPAGEGAGSSPRQMAWMQAIIHRSTEALERARDGVLRQREVTERDIREWRRMESALGKTVQNLLRQAQGPLAGNLNELLEQLQAQLSQGEEILERHRGLEDSVLRLLDQMLTAWRQDEPDSV